MARILATFRIEENDWNAFKRLTDSKGTNASQEIVKFIKSCIDGSDLSSIDIVNTINLDERIAGYLDSNLEASIDKCIDKYLDDYVDIGQLDHRVKSINDEFNLKISHLCDRINRLESQLSENSHQNYLEDVSEEGKAQTQAKEPSKPEIANIEAIKDFAKDKDILEIPDLLSVGELEDNTANRNKLGKLIKEILPEYESRQGSSKRKPNKRYYQKKSLDPVELTTTSDQSESDI